MYLKSNELMRLFLCVCRLGKVKNSRRKNGKQHVSRLSRTINQLIITMVMGHSKTRTKLHLEGIVMLGIKQTTNRTMIVAIMVCPKRF